MYTIASKLKEINSYRPFEKSIYMCRNIIYLSKTLTCIHCNILLLCFGKSHYPRLSIYVIN